MRYSGYQNILSKVRYDYGSFDKDLSIIMIIVSGDVYILLLRKFINNLARCCTHIPRQKSGQSNSHMKDWFQMGRYRGCLKLLSGNWLERLCECLTLGNWLIALDGLFMLQNRLIFCSGAGIAYIIFDSDLSIRIDFKQ